MNVKQTSFIPLVIFILLSFSCASRAAGSGKPVPHAYLPEISYEFRPVLDGEPVPHDFIVLNRGQAPLEILEVKPDCGCTTVSFSPHVSPGGKGKIAILLNTMGFGGEHLVKTIAVRTNDPGRPAVKLILTGDVRPLADIVPADVKLTGNAVQEIRQTVSITPVKENPFRILEARTEKGRDIRYELKEEKSAGTMHYRLDVFNTRQAKGWYIDNIYLKTTSRKSPVLKIRVLGIIRESGRSDS